MPRIAADGAFALSSRRPWHHPSDAEPVSPIAPAAVPPGTTTATGPTHPCARCGAPVALDVGLCDRCNPLGLKDSASSQVHGSVFLGIGIAVAVLAIGAHFAVSGIGPFESAVTS